MAEYVNKFKRGLDYRTHLYVHSIGPEWIFADQPCCPHAAAAWEERDQCRKVMTDEQRLQDSFIKNGGFHPDKPWDGYDRSCSCEVCRLAYSARFYKGLLGHPSETTKQTLDPHYTTASVKARVEQLTLTWKTLPRAEVLFPPIAEALEQRKPLVAQVDLPQSKFDALVFRVVREMWSKLIQGGEFYLVSPTDRKKTTHPQPDWGYLSGINEIGVFTREEHEEIGKDFNSRSFTAFHVPGPFSEAQAMFVFGPIRAASAKDNVVLVNTDDVTLKSYVGRLQKQLE